MKLETFFEKFDQFADAPDAVAKMRELVLELSATGRLVPEALERPVEEDTKLMGAIVELVMGQAPAGDEYNTEGRGTVFVKVGEFGPLYPREEVWTTNPLKFAKKGDVLVCVVGATVGKLNLAIDCAIGRSAAAIRPSSALDTKFLYYSLIPYTLRLRRNSRGSAQGVIGKAELNAVSLWVPSREVQKRIVAKVDELMALCDRLEALETERQSRERGITRASLARFADAPTPANLHFLFHSSFRIPPSDLRKSILTLAVQGKLVPQDPNDEPAEGLLTRILAEKERIVAINVIGHLKEWPLDEELQPTFKLPASWIFSTLGEIGLISPRNKAADDMVASFVPMKLISAELREPHGQETRKWAEIKTGFTHFAEGDVSLAKITPCFENGKSAVMRNLANGIGAGTTELHIVRPLFVEADYILIFLKSSLFVEAGIPKMTGTAGQKRVPTSYFASSPFPLPPLTEQHRIVAKVEQLMALVDALETQLAASRATAANLLTALVAELTTAA